VVKLKSMKEKPLIKKYDEAFKREAVELVLKKGNKQIKVAHGLGISESTLRDWRYKYGEQIEIPKGNTPEELEEENRRLRRELESARTQRDILKKVWGIFSEDLSGGMPR